MNQEVLPYNLLLIMAELTIGSLWVTTATDLRGGVTRGFVLTMALCVVVAGGLTYWAASAINLQPAVDGFAIDEGWFEPARRGLLVVILASFIYMVSVFMGWDPVGRISGLAGSVAGLWVIVCYAAMLAPPTWGFPGSFAALMAGTAAMGAVTVAMVWGHWYLTEGSLPAWPMRELAWLLVFAVGVQTVVVAVNLAVPERITPTPSNPVDVGLLQNPVLWLRIGVGLAFTAVLAVLSLRTAQIRAMQSATGLLYLGMATVFTGEVLAKGLLFITGKPI